MLILIEHKYVCVCLMHTIVCRLFELYICVCVCTLTAVLQQIIRLMEGYAFVLVITGTRGKTSYMIVWV